MKIKTANFLSSPFFYNKHKGTGPVDVNSLVHVDGKGSTDKAITMHRVKALDLKGKHEAAVSLLAELARSGNVEAMTILAKRFLVGDRATVSPKQGLELLIEASNLGGSEAPALLSVLFGLGLQVEQSWAHALDCLTMAAERGEVSAQGQLKALSADEHLATMNSAMDDADYWKDLCASIDLSRWNSRPFEMAKTKTTGM